MTSRPELTYFDIRGRAEPIRLLLEEAGVAYDDVQVPSERWPELKPRLPFGELPRLRIDGHELFQTYAICRYLARRHGLEGEKEAQRLRCDVAVEALRDAKDQMGHAFWRPGFEEQRGVFVEQELRPRLDALARFHETNPARSGFWAGDSPTLADLVAFSYLEDVEALYPGVSNGGSLETFRVRFAERPRIAAYLRSGRRPAAIQYGPAGRIHPVERR